MIRRKPGPRRKARQVPDPVWFNVYDGRVYGSAGDGIRVVMYDGDPADRGDAGIISGIHLPQLDDMSFDDEWFLPNELPRRVRRALVEEYPTWLGKGVLA
jgi:hypothetical protein